MERNGENKTMYRPSFRSRIPKGNYDHLHNETVGPSEDRRSAIDLAIIREDLSRPQMFLRWVDGKAQVADALTKLHGDGDSLRAVCRQAFTVLVEAPEIMAARRQEKARKGKGTESQVTFKGAVACGRNFDTCDHNDNRDLT